MTGSPPKPNSPTGQLTDRPTHRQANSPTGQLTDRKVFVRSGRLCVLLTAVGGPTRVGPPEAGVRSKRARCVIQLLRPERLGRSLPQQKEGEMNQVEKAARFAELHVKGAPLLLYNAWDAGTAKSILDAGAKAIATSRWAVAEGEGAGDCEGD